jgi:hypothetical protein
VIQRDFTCAREFLWQVLGLLDQLRDLAFEEGQLRRLRWRTVSRIFS